MSVRPSQSAKFGDLPRQTSHPDIEDAAVPAKTFYDGFSANGSVRYLVPLLGQGDESISSGFNNDFNAELLTFIEGVSGIIRLSRRFLRDGKAQPAIVRPARAKLSANFRQMQQLPAPDRLTFREAQFNRYGRMALASTTTFAEVAIAADIAEGFKNSGQIEAVKAIGNSLIAFGQVIEEITT